MTIEEYLGQIAENSESYFQAHLAKEDLLRVERLSAMAAATPDLETLQKEALYSGWTPGDLRTGELKEVLLPLIAAFHARAHGADGEAELLEAWKRFHEQRIKVLIHCL